jgi:hypothetical protein
VGCSKFISQCLFGFLLISVVFSATSTIPGQLQNQNIQNETDADRSSLGGMTTPLVSNSLLTEIDNESFSFSTQESVTRLFSQPNITQQTLIPIEAPTNYTYANLSIAFDIVGNGTSQLLIGGDATLNTDDFLIHAQSFTITQKVYVDELSILFRDGKKGITPNITICQDNQTGTIVYDLSRHISDEEDGWVNLLPGRIVLDPGLYYLVLEKTLAETANQFKQWQKTDTNTTHTVYYDSTWISADFDLSLRLNMTGFIEDVSKVEVYVNAHPMQYDGDSALWQLEFDMSGVNQTIELAITSNITAIYTYEIVVTYFQDGFLYPTLEILPVELFYNFSLSLNKPSSDYESYQVVVGGVYPDFYNIKILKNSTEVSYQRISPLEIEFSTDADHLEFYSMNAIEDIAVIDTNFIGDSTQVNVTTGYVGNVTLNIYEADELVYTNTSETGGFTSFMWELNPPFVEQNLQIETIFIGQNHAGWGEDVIALIYQTSINASSLRAFTVGEITLECDYFDIISNETIDNALVTYDFEGLSGSLEQNISGGYQSTLDLAQYNFLPGNYTITYHASRDGFIPQTIQQQIEIRIYQTSISASTLSAYVFEEITLECNYMELLSNDTIDSALVRYNFEGLSGSMEQSGPNGYQRTMNLAQYNILPGNYTITYHASRDGFIPQTLQQQIEVQPRLVGISINQNSDTLQQGDQLRLTIYLEDVLTTNGLLLTADIKISIHSSDVDSDLVIFSETARNIETNYTFTLPIESDLNPGNYSLTIEILSDYYEGVFTQTTFFEILSPEGFPLYYLLAIIPLLGIGLNILIFQIKKSVKRSLQGLLILHENGVLIGEKIESDFSHKDPLLISGVISGMIILIQEITGGRLKTLEIDGGYMSLARGDEYWIVIFIKKNPWWIRKTIKKLVSNISEEFGHEIMNYTGERIPISIDNLTFEYFGKIIEPDFIKSPANGHINVQNVEETVTPEAPNLPQSVHETEEMPPK